VPSSSPSSSYPMTCWTAILMGRQAALICSRMRQARGSPGAGLALPFANTSTRPGTALGLATPYLSILQSWQFPVTRLALGSDVVVDGPTCHTIATALPNLKQLTCEKIDPAYNSTSLHGPWHCALTFAPQQRPTT
jgi:hypothetical protein